MRTGDGPTAVQRRNEQPSFRPNAGAYGLCLAMQSGDRLRGQLSVKLNTWVPGSYAIACCSSDPMHSRRDKQPQSLSAASVRALVRGAIQVTGLSWAQMTDRLRSRLI